MSKRTRNQILDSLTTEHTRYWATATTAHTVRPTSTNLNSARKHREKHSEKKTLDMSNSKAITQITANPIFMRNYYTLLSPEERSKIGKYLENKHRTTKPRTFVQAYKSINWPSAYQATAKFNRPRKEIDLAESILRKYNSNYIEQKKQMRQYISLWLSNVMKIVETHKVLPEFYEFISQQIHSKEFIEMFDLQKPISREQLFESFREYLIKVSQTPKHGLSIETQAQLKSILHYDARISNEYTSLLCKEKEYHDRYLQMHLDQSPLRDSSVVGNLIHNSEKIVVDASRSNKVIMKKQVDNFSTCVIQKFLICCSNQYQQAVRLLGS